MVQDRCIVSTVLKLNRNLYAIYRMVTLQVTPNPQTNRISTFCVAFNILTVGVQIDHRKSQLTDNKPSLKDAWSCHVTHFKFLVPLKYF